MRSLSLSFAERVLPRAASALIVLLLALFLSPAEVGLYSTVIIAVTLVQAVSDGAIRQISVSAIASSAGRRFLRTYAIVTAVGGGLLVGGVAVVVVVVAGPTERVQSFSLLALALVPAIVAARVSGLALLQSTGAWANLAKYQAIGSFGSLALSTGVLLLTQNLLAATLQMVVSESVFTILVRRQASGTTGMQNDVSTERSFRSEFLHLSGYSLVAWLQSQLDRVLLVFLAGPARLALFSLAWSVSRAGSDALSASTANVVRPMLLLENHRTRFETTIERALLAQGAVYLLTVGGTFLILAPVLDAEWDAALRAVPIFALSGFASVVEWSVTVALVAHSRVQWATPIKALGILLAVPIAFAAVTNLEQAAWWVVIREVVVMSLLIVAGRWYCLRAGLLAIAATTLIGLILLLTRALGI